MYIAFKWLVSMTLAMWITLCSIELHTNVIKKHSTEYKTQNVLFENSSTLIKPHNIVPESKRKITYIRNHQKSPLIQYLMFIMSASIVFILNKKNKIIMFTKRRLTMFKQKEFNYLWLSNFLKNIFISLNGALMKCIELSSYIIHHLKKPIFLHLKHKHPNINLLLLNKLGEYGQERRNIGHLLITAIQENKNIRMLYQLEAMAKQRLVKYIEDTQRLTKENRNRCLNFQQLYLVTHQENVFLKSLIKKLTQEKQDAERNLIRLVNEVCQSKNSELKDFCSRFKVRPKNNLLNSDVRSEIKQFLSNSSNSGSFSNLTNDTNKKLQSQRKDNEKYNVLKKEKNRISLMKYAPKLRGLPGECICTIKDKEGFIEKLYEYETDFDNGDTIRRIRQYSVYHDKDCLLDVSSSTTLVRDKKSEFSRLRSQYMDTRHITGSQVFQNFLQNNKNVLVQRRKSSILMLKN